MSGQTPRFYATNFKERIVHRLEAGERIGAVAAEIGVARKLLYEWRDAYRAMGVEGLNRRRGRRAGWRSASSSASRALSEPPPASDVGPSAARDADELTKARARIAELERLVGRQQADLDFFREALQSWDARSRKSGAPISTRSSKR